VVTTRVEQNLRGARVVKAFAQEETEIARFDAENSHWFNLSARAAHLQAVSAPLLTLIANKSKPVPSDSQARCGLCGKTGNLTKTECCGHWICNDEDKYVLFSYARNSCHRNHDRYTLCGYHYNEGHAGDWKDCPDCRKAFEPELYVHRGINEYNFEKLPNPPEFEPTKCIECGARIQLGEEGYSVGPEGYKCERCTSRELPNL